MSPENIILSTDTCIILMLYFLRQLSPSGEMVMEMMHILRGLQHNRYYTVDFFPPSLEDRIELDMLLKKQPPYSIP